MVLCSSSLCYRLFVTLFSFLFKLEVFWSSSRQVTSGTTQAKKIVTAGIFMRLSRSAIMWYHATSTWTWWHELATRKGCRSRRCRTEAQFSPLHPYTHTGHRDWFGCPAVTAATDSVLGLQPRVLCSCFMLGVIPDKTAASVCNPYFSHVTWRSAYKKMVTVQGGFAGTSAGVAERENSNPVFPAQAGNIGN